MLKSLARFSLTATVALCIAACGRDSAPPATAASGADDAIRTSARLARANDIGGLFEHMLPPAEFARIKAEWSDNKDEVPLTDEERQRFADAMAMLTADDAVDTLYALIEPDLSQFDAQYKQQLPTVVAMGQAYVQGLVQQSQHLSAAEKAHADQAIKAVAEWVQVTRFTDPALVRRAIGIASETAKRLDLKSLDEARALDFDQSTHKIGIAFDGLKQILDVYGFSIDQSLDSVRTEILASTGETASVKVDYELLGTRLTTRSEMVRVDGRWFAKDTIEKIRSLDGSPTGSAAGAR